MSKIFNRKKIIKEHTKWNLNRSDIIAFNDVIMLPTQYIFLEKV